MKYRRLALLIACLTAVLAVAFQLKSQNTQYRFHQHKQATLTEKLNTDGTGCITTTQKSQHQYDAAAVDVEKLQTHLPLVILETEEEIPGAPYYDDASDRLLYTKADNGEAEARATMKIIDNSDALNRPQDTPALRSDIKISVRGNTSRWFDKKSYAVKLVDSMGNHENQKVLGMEANHSWALHGPFLDKTLMRNYIGMNISGELMDYAPDVRFCEVILNGDYQGLYLFMETVNRGKGRINIEKPNLTRNVTGYIIELDNGGMPPPTSPDNFTKYTGILRNTAFFDIVYPNATALTPAMKDYITRDLSRCEKALYSYDYDTKKYGFQTFMDVGEFTDYFILNEVFLQHDMGNLSTYFYKGVDGLFSPCVWDFNHSMGNASIGAANDFSVLQFVSVQAPWFWMMIKDESFIDSVISRYHSLREGILSDEEMSQYIADTRAYLGSAVERNFAVWGYSFDPENLDDHNKLRPLSQNPRSYDQAVEQMEDTLLDRLHWLDENIEALKQYSHESAVKKFNQ